MENLKSPFCVCVCVGGCGWMGFKSLPYAPLVGDVLDGMILGKFTVRVVKMGGCGYARQSHSGSRNDFRIIMAYPP